MEYFCTTTRSGIKVLSDVWIYYGIMLQDLMKQLVWPKTIFLRFIKRFLTSLFRVCRFGAAHGRLGKFETTSSPFIVRRKYPTMIKNHTVIPYLKRIQKLYKFHNAYFKSCWHQQFFVEIFEEIQTKSTFFF